MKTACHRPLRPLPLATLLLAAVFAVALPLGQPVLAQPSPQPSYPATLFERAYNVILEEHISAPGAAALLAAAVEGLRGAGHSPPAVEDPRALAEYLGSLAGSLGRTDAEDLAFIAIRAMVRFLDDPYARFAPPSQSDALEFSSPVYGGIGVRIGFQGRWPSVEEVFPESPAARAGLAPGDLITEIGGVDTATLDQQAIVERLRGPPGTRVAITVRRASSTFGVTLTRAIVNSLALEVKLVAPGVAYLKLTGFPIGADAAFADALQRALQDGSRALVLDLRDNPGGLLSESVAVASHFVPTGLITSVRGRSRDTEYEVIPTTPFFAGPVAVLVNQRSASGAELVAAALKEHGAAVVGTRTFGKGSVQIAVRLPGGSSLRLTVAQYTTPRGEQVDRVGVAPDFVVELGAGGGDLQLDAAVAELLRRLGWTLHPGRGGSWERELAPAY
jgi:carboxyl-terminal processing protease